jgi:DnaK suppressor protein
MATMQPTARTGEGKVERARRRLMEQKAELSGERQALLGKLPADRREVKDEEEFCADRHERSTVCALVELKARMAQEVDDALRRVESGAYGICESCGEDISPARLQAVPFAVRCRACQEAAESGDDWLGGAA